MTLGELNQVVGATIVDWTDQTLEASNDSLLFLSAIASKLHSEMQSQSFDLELEEKVLSSLNHFIAMDSSFVYVLLLKLVMLLVIRLSENESNSFREYQKYSWSERMRWTKPDAHGIALLLCEIEIHVSSSKFSKEWGLLRSKWEDRLMSASSLSTLVDSLEDLCKNIVWSKPWDIQVLWDLAISNFPRTKAAF